MRHRKRSNAFVVLLLLAAAGLIRPDPAPAGPARTTGQRRAGILADNAPGERGSPLRILFAGDTSFGESYQATIKRLDGADILKQKGYDYCIAGLAPLLASADLVVANLETPLTSPSAAPVHQAKKYIHWADPARTPAALRKHNMGAVSLANNHMLDYGLAGLLHTREALCAHSIAGFGAGLTAQEAAEPLRRDMPLGGKTFRLIVASGFAYSTTYDSRYGFYARGDKGGVNSWDIPQASRQIKDIRSQSPRAFIVAFPHWGRNYSWKTDSQAELARALVDAGADLVIGHGAHVMQEIEQYRQRWIIYGLGNFMFIAPGRYQKKKAAPFSLAVRLDVAGTGDEPSAVLRLYPLFSDNRRTGYQPRPVAEQEFAGVRELLVSRSPEPGMLKKALQTGHDEVGWFLRLTVR